MLRSFVSFVLTLAWALWLGGLVALLLTVGVIFKTFPEQRELAGLAAGNVFHVFLRYQLILAAVALLAAVLLRWRSPRKAHAWFFGMLSATTLLAVVLSLYVTPRIDRLREQKQTHEARFRQLHGLSMGLFAAEAALLLAAGAVLPYAQPRKDRED